VTVLARDEHVLHRENPDAAKVVEEALKKDGVTLAYSLEFKGVESKAGKPPVTLVVEDQGEYRRFEFDALLVAT
jgi:pyruvate/2-oxoglutarate dehydrogenase complex dihydrolipoamide dehydrogenase (E3) component